MFIMMPRSRYNFTLNYYKTNVQISSITCKGLCFRIDSLRNKTETISTEVEIEAEENSSPFEIYSAIPDTMEQIDITDNQLSVACSEDSGKLQNCGQYYFSLLWIEF